jgi:hypothetical protein
MKENHAPVTTINLNINGKVNNISINPINILSANNQITAPQVQSSMACNQKPILLNDPSTSKNGINNVASRRGSDGQIIQRNKLQSQKADNKIPQGNPGTG